MFRAWLFGMLLVCPSVHAYILLQEKLVSTDTAVRQAAFAEFDRLPPGSRQPIIVALLSFIFQSQTEDYGGAAMMRAVRAGDALGRCRAEMNWLAPSLVDFLRGARDQSYSARAAMAGLKGLGPGALQWVVPLLSDSDPKNRLAGIQTYVFVDPWSPKNIEIMKPLLIDPDPRVRQAAAEAIHPLGAEATASIQAANKTLAKQPPQAMATAKDVPGQEPIGSNSYAGVGLFLTGCALFLAGLWILWRRRTR